MLFIPTDLMPYWRQLSTLWVGVLDQPTPRDFPLLSPPPPLSVVLTDDSPSEAPRVIHGVREGGVCHEGLSRPLSALYVCETCSGRRVCCAQVRVLQVPSKCNVAPPGKGCTPVPSPLSGATAMPLYFRAKSPRTHRVAPGQFL